MSKISDIIEKFIIQLLSESEGAVEIKRNELANYFDCAPSQINYVLTTRFNSNRGYIIESYRGGGGCIRIMKASLGEEEYLTNILANQIGESINKERAYELIHMLYKQCLIDETTRSVMNKAIDDITLTIISKPLRDNLRANILKAMIVAALV